MRELQSFELKCTNAGIDDNYHLFLEGAFFASIMGSAFHYIHSSTIIPSYTACWALGGGLLNILANVDLPDDILE